MVLATKAAAGEREFQGHQPYPLLVKRSGTTNHRCAKTSPGQVLLITCRPSNQARKATKLRHSFLTCLLTPLTSIPCAVDATALLRVWISHLNPHGSRLRLLGTSCGLLNFRELELENVGFGSCKSSTVVDGLFLRVFKVALLKRKRHRGWRDCMQSKNEIVRERRQESLAELGTCSRMVCGIEILAGATGMQSSRPANHSQRGAAL